MDAECNDAGVEERLDVVGGGIVGVGTVDSDSFKEVTSGALVVSLTGAEIL